MAMRLKPRRDRVCLALRELLENHRQTDLREFRGADGIRPSYDQKPLRER